MSVVSWVNWGAVLILTFASGASRALEPDADSDGRPDAFDNCVEVANPSQCDTDLDGFGNHCDGDFNQDAQVNGIDFVEHLRVNLGGDSSESQVTDLDCDGDTDIQDQIRWASQEYAKGRPGPSAASVVKMVRVPEVVNGKSFFIHGWVEDPSTWGPKGAPCALRNGTALAHRVQVPSFEISGTEVTRAEWREIMGTDAYTTGTECGDCPARINWFSAAAFANALSASKGLAACYQFVGTGCNGVPGEDPSAGGLTCSGASSGVKVTGTGDPYDCEGYRIPTEAEWAKAARGDDPKTVSAWTPAGNPDPASAAQYCSVYAPAGSLPLFTAEAVPAPTGKTLDDIAWWIGSIGNDPYYIGSASWVSAEAQGVRQKLPAYFDHTPVFDMIGNAPEWGFGPRLVSWADDPRFEECSKVSGAPAGCDPEAVTVNPFGGRVGETYVGGRPYVDLGGEIRYFAEDVSVTYRSSVFPNQRTPGIRVVRTLHGE